MKTTIVRWLLPALCISAAGLSAQTTLPYNTGFDSAPQQAGWTEYKKAGTATGGWFYNTFLPYSPPNTLYQIYSTNEDLDNWMVSPPFEIPDGGQLDSIRYMFNGFSVPSGTDTVALYLLNGSADPDLATKTLLFNFYDTNYVNDGVYRKLSNITLPGGAGSSYLAIRYKCEVFHWLETRFDNVAISAAPGTGLADAEELNIAVYPNPAQRLVEVENNNPHSAEFHLFNTQGQVVRSFSLKGSQRVTLDLEEQAAGLYFLEVTAAQKTGRVKVIKR